jgi:CheY-like chemotaxis protein
VRPKILIVEDDRDLQELYTMMLEGVDCELVLAFDGQEALDKLTDPLPDLLILDILLDNVMGNEVLAHMRQGPRYADIPVIVVSVLSADRCEDLMTMDDRTVFLRKPFRREELLKAVRESLIHGTQEA